MNSKHSSFLLEFSAASAAVSASKVAALLALDTPYSMQVRKGLET